ncbi:hypothetical protein FQR65_LT11521 [Abscondita terminalis]|nr:hypothetical protein FQR65_LT11521 [Abscondita terminalis]
MPDQIKPAIVLDHGTFTTRIGLSNLDNPVLLPTQTKSLKQPISGGIINDFTTMEELWQEMFDALKVNAKDHRMLITEPLNNYEKDRERLCEIMFETFGVPSMYLVPTPVLALFNSGQTSGIVYSSGSDFGTTFAVPVYEGHLMSSSCVRLPISGKTFDSTLRSLLQDRYTFIQNLDAGVIRKIKESSCYVAQNYKKELESFTFIDYVLPDGQVIQLGEERCRCSEGLFNPSILDVECDGIHTLIHNVILNFDDDLRKVFFENIVLDGGSSMFEGIAERLRKEIEALNKSMDHVKIFAPPKRSEAVWRGGAMLSNLSTFDSWMSKSDFSELGTVAMNRNSCKMTTEIKPAIVLDHGTLTTRAGLSDQEDPALISSETKSMKRPIVAGVINDFTAMEELWHEIFAALKVDAKDYRILIAEPLNNYEKNRENVCEIMFETFSVPAMCSIPSSTLALYNSGRTNGVVYTSGSAFGTTYAVPILEGIVQPFSCCRLPIAGITFDSTLRNLLTRSNNFMKDVNVSIIRNIKETSCYVAKNYEKELASLTPVDYKLPDGKVIQLGEERFRCAEGLFNPTILDAECDGVHTLIYNAIMKCDEERRKTLLANIVLDGGSTMFPGIAERMQKEIETLNVSKSKVKVYAPPKRSEAVWRGGTLLANLSTFQNWVTRENFLESGVTTLNKK